MAGSDNVSVAIVGSGGAGTLTTGHLLLEAAGAGGGYGLLVRTAGPQIRGGEAAALLRLSNRPVECLGGGFDLLIGIDWVNAARFGAEIQVGPHTLVISDPAGGDLPAIFTAPGPRIVEVPLKELARSVPGGRPNMVALGVAARLLGIDARACLAPIARRLADKGGEAVDASRAALEAGVAAAAGIAFDAGDGRGTSRPQGGPRWLASGNEMTGLGAIRGGVRFAAAYPITPASEVLEWLAPGLARVGGILLQAEDELAAANMIIGASYGGTPALTATSGPGLSLMVEALGLAVAAEVPVVVVDVMRGGPSTGIPTKSEQSDLNIAVYGLHGDAPHLVLAPQSVSDCLFATQWAVYLSEALQAPAIVLSDQFIGQAVALMDRPADAALLTQRSRAVDAGGGYRRYALTAGGVSPMAIPGQRGGQYTAEGLTHSEQGRPTSGAFEHGAQLDKRRDKLDGYAYGDAWASVEGQGEIAVITWGSLTGAAREAIAQLQSGGTAVRLLAPRLLLPTRPQAFAAALDGVRRALVVEQSHGAQFHRFLRAHYDLPAEVRVLNRPGPLPIRPAEIAQALLRWGP